MFSDKIKRRLIAIWLFCVMYWLIPSYIMFWDWLAFVLIVSFWAVIAFGVACWALSVYQGWIEDRND